MVKGFTMDDERLKGNGGGNYWKELLDRIRDIRSSEKVLYCQVLDLYATSVDYNPIIRWIQGIFPQQRGGIFRVLLWNEFPTTTDWCWLVLLIPYFVDYMDCMDGITPGGLGGQVTFIRNENNWQKIEHARWIEKTGIFCR